MVVIVFRSRIVTGSEKESGVPGARMHDIASQMPGFVSDKNFAAENGEIAMNVEFDTPEHLSESRKSSQHKEVQRLGHDRFVSTYHTHVCNTVREYPFHRPD